MTKPVLPKSIYEGNSLGQLALSLVGDEGASEIFTLLTTLMLVRMSATEVKMEGVGGEILTGDDWLPDSETPVCFQKPYGERTMKIVGHLEKLGYIKLLSKNSRGCAYNVVVPEKSARDKWFEDALMTLEPFAVEVANTADRAAYWRKRAGVN